MRIIYRRNWGSSARSNGGSGEFPDCLPNDNHGLGTLAETKRLLWLGGVSSRIDRTASSREDVFRPPGYRKPFSGGPELTQQITIETFVPVPPTVAWSAFTTPEAITQWNFATPEWCCPSAEVDLREGGAYSARMEARDGTMGFDFAGTYDEVDARRALTLRLEDGRRARTTFEPEAGGTRVRTVFDPESENPIELQRDGWQAILDNYAAYVRRIRT